MQRALRHRHRRGLRDRNIQAVCRIRCFIRAGCYRVAQVAAGRCRRAVGVQFRLGEGVRRTTGHARTHRQTRRRTAHIVVVVVVHQPDARQRHIARVRHQVTVAHRARRAQARGARALRHRHRRGLRDRNIQAVCRIRCFIRAGCYRVAQVAAGRCRRAVGVQFRLGEGVRRTTGHVRTHRQTRRRTAHIVVVVVIHQRDARQRYIACVRHQVTVAHRARRAQARRASSSSPPSSTGSA